MELTNELAKKAKSKGLWLRHGITQYTWLSPEEYQEMVNEGKIILNESCMSIEDPETALQLARAKITAMIDKTNRFEDKLRLYYKTTSK